jgi:hypothetical protein
MSRGAQNRSKDATTPVVGRYVQKPKTGVMANPAIVYLPLRNAYWLSSHVTHTQFVPQLRHSILTYA